MRHSVVLTPLANALKEAIYVGGSIRDSNGVVIVRAIDDISFCIGRGERVGLIGHRRRREDLPPFCVYWAEIFEPTRRSFTLEVSGQVKTLFNLMEGLMPDATGREFIRMRAVLLGFDPQQIAPLVEEVAEWCELGDYIDMPVRTYSTGMLVRVAFAIATSMTADILLFDELIGAGDARFLKKAEDRLRSFTERSSVVIIANWQTHDIMRKWCSRGLLLEHGRLVHDGDVNSVLKKYDERRAESERELARAVE